MKINRIKKWFLVACFMGIAFLFAQISSADEYDQVISEQPLLSEVPPPPPPPSHSLRRESRDSSRRRHRRPDFPAHQYRDQLKELGKKVRANRDLIKSLELELSDTSPGPSQSELQVRLQAALKERARLRLILSQVKVRITGKGLENARIRHEQALDDQNLLKEWLAEYYPEVLKAHELKEGTKIESSASD